MFIDNDALTTALADAQCTQCTAEPGIDIDGENWSAVAAHFAECPTLSAETRARLLAEETRLAATALHCSICNAVEHPADLPMPDDPFDDDQPTKETYMSTTGPRWTTIAVTPLPPGWRNCYRVADAVQAIPCPALLLQEDRSAIDRRTRVTYAEAAVNLVDLHGVVHTDNYLGTIGPDREVPPLSWFDEADDEF